jgi:hypothetical protein
MKSHRSLVALFTFIGLLALTTADGVTGLATIDDKLQVQQQGPAKKIPPPMDYVIPVPKITLVDIPVVQKNIGQFNWLRIAIENWKDFADGLFVQINNPYMPGCGNDPKPIQDKEKFTRLVTQFYDENNQRLGDCAYGSNTKSNFKSQSFFLPTSEPLPKFVYLLLTDSKTGKQYKSNRISLAPNKP